MMRKVIAVFLLVSCLLVSCYKNKVNSTTCDYDPCAIKAPANEIASVESYLNSTGITTAIKHCSGMYYEISAAGTDKSPVICSYVSVHYNVQIVDAPRRPSMKRLHARHSRRRR